MNAPANTGKAIAVQPKLMLLEFMADKYGLQPQQFADTVRKTCGLPNASAEEFAAFMMVCREYDLNPILREIHAFPKRGGGIVPIVGVDGWLNLINSQPQCDGFEFDTHHNNDNGELVSMTCRLYRKDRSHPVEVTEYLSECIRDTEPWKMKHRMLRHKTLMQAGRYAFGFSGIYDEDEGARIAEVPTSEPPKPPRPNSAPPRPNGSAQPAGEPAKQQPPKPANDQQSELAGKQIEDADIDDEIPSFDRDTGEIVDGEVDEREPDPKTPSDLLTALDDDMAVAKDEATVLEVWEAHDIEAALTHMDQGDQFAAIARAIRDRSLKRVKGKN
jgi:phage recombination protein Bet